MATRPLPTRPPVTGGVVASTVDNAQNTGSTAESTGAALARIDALIAALPTAPKDARTIHAQPTPAPTGAAPDARSHTHITAPAPSRDAHTHTRSHTGPTRMPNEHSHAPRCASQVAAPDTDAASLVTASACAVLREDTLSQLRSYMSSRPGDEVDAVFNDTLDALARTAASSGAATTAPQSTGGAVASLARGLLSRVSSVTTTPEAPTGHPPSASGVSVSAPAAITLTHTHGDAAALPSDYPDVRVSTHVLTFGPSHAVAAGDVDASGAARAGKAGPTAGAHTHAHAPASQSLRHLPIMSGETGSGEAASTGPRRRFAAGARRASTGSAVEALVPTPVHTHLQQVLEFTNLSKSKAHVNIRPLQAFPEGSTCYISVEPSSVVVKKGETAAVRVNVQLLRPGALVEAFVAVEVVGGLRLLVLVRALAERSVFGLRPQESELTSSGGYEGIPMPLAQLYSRIVESDGGRALLQEGLFRLAPSGDEVRKLRDQLNNGTFAGATSSCSAVAAAHMIKVFLREMPQRILEAVPAEALLSASTEAQCEALCERYLSPGYQTLLNWLLDLLVKVAQHGEHNRMSAKSLAVCLGPNLFVSNEAVNPMEALMTSQKAVNLLEKRLTKRIADAH